MTLQLITAPHSALRPVRFQESVWPHRCISLPRVRDQPGICGARRNGEDGEPQRDFGNDKSSSLDLKVHLKVHLECWNSTLLSILWPWKLFNTSSDSSSEIPNPTLEIPSFEQSLATNSDWIHQHSSRLLWSVCGQLFPLWSFSRVCGQTWE